MKRNELIELRELVKKEIERRERINTLLESDLVREYIELTNIPIYELDSENIREILNDILKDYKITKTNGIYVCTSAYYMDCHISYEDTEYYTQDVNINSEYAEHKTYRDIESGKVVRAIQKKEQNYARPLISVFENEEIVLNPYNTGKDLNGYYEVRMDFMEEAINKGQAQAKRLVLSKYKKM